MVENDAILIVLLESMGDIIACEPVARYLKELYPNRPLYWVTTARFAELVQYNPYLKGVISMYDMEQWVKYRAGLSKTVKIVDLHFRKRQYIMAKGKVYTNQNDSAITEDNYYNMGGSLLEIMSKTAGLEGLNTSLVFHRRPERFIHSLHRPYVVFHAVSSTTERDWLKEKWIELINVLATMGFDGVEVGQEPTLPLDLPNYINKTNLLSVHDSADIIADAVCFIGIDSSMAHIANALNVPGIVLLGKYRTFERYMPYTGNYQKGIKSRIVYASAGKAAASISVTEVITAFKNIQSEILHN